MFDYDIYYIETYWGYDVFYDSYTDTHFVPEISKTKDFINTVRKFRISFQKSECGM